MGPAGSFCTSVNELLVPCNELVKASKKEETDWEPKTASSYFGEVQTLLSPPTVLTPPPFGLSTDTTYSRAGTRSTTRKAWCHLSNTGLVDEIPFIGQGSTPQIVFYNSRTLTGFYSSVCLMPETQSCIVSLASTHPVFNSAD